MSLSEGEDTSRLSMLRKHYTGEQSRNGSFDHVSPAFGSINRTMAKRSAIFSLVSTILGGGVLSLPFAFSKTGLIGGPLILIFCALLSDYSLKLLLLAARYGSAVETFEEVAKKAYGRKAQITTVLLLFLLTWMCCVAYAVLIGDLLAPLVSWAVPGVTIGDSEDWKRKVLIVVATSCVAPLGVLRSLNALRFTSAFCVISVTLLAVCIGYKSVTDGYGFDHTDSQDSDPTYHKHLKLWPESFGDILYATPIFFISYLCHFNVLSTHCEMKQPSLKRLSHVIHATTSVCTVLYVAVGVLGYLYREEGTCGDILDNFTNDDTLINVGRLALALTLGLSYPLLVLPCRDSFYRLVMMLKHDLSTPTMPDMSSPSFTRLQALEEENEENNHVARSQPLLEESTSIVMDARRLEMSLKLRAMVALCIVGTALIAACVLPGIVVVWSFMGSSVSVLIAFVFPSLMYLKVTWKRKMHLDRALSGILLVFSVLVMIGSTYEAVVNSMDKNADKCLKLSSD